MAQTPNSSASGAGEMSNAEAVRTLALRLLAPRFPGDVLQGETQLLVGQVSEEVAALVPLPEGSRLLGSLVRGRQNVEIMFDSDDAPDAVLGFYSERLAAAGWQRVEQPRPIGGFTFGTSMEHVLYCRAARGPGLIIMADGAQNDATQVRLDLQLDPRHSPCVHLGRSEMDNSWAVIPTLRPPQGALQTPSGGGGGGNHVFSAATLTSDLAIADVAAHYVAQLEQAGWTRQGEAQAAPLVSSTWTFDDQTGQAWQGLFLVVEMATTPRQYMVQAHAYWPTGGPDGGSGWNAIVGMA